MTGPPLHDDIWTRRGISLLWDADSLGEVSTPHQVVSLRRFLHLHSLGWPDDRLPLLNDEVMVVAGLESAIDALPPDEACEWLEQVVYKAIVSYQREVADGGSQAALVFWVVERERLVYQASDDTYRWHCGTEYRGRQIPIGQCLFNGAQQDLRRLEVADGAKSGRWIGLFHPRIS